MRSFFFFVSSSSSSFPPLRPQEFCSWFCQSYGKIREGRGRETKHGVVMIVQRFEKI